MKFYFSYFFFLFIGFISCKKEVKQNSPIEGYEGNSNLIFKQKIKIETDFDSLVFVGKYNFNDYFKVIYLDKQNSINSFYFKNDEFLEWNVKALEQFTEYTKFKLNENNNLIVLDEKNSIIESDFNVFNTLNLDNGFKKDLMIYNSSIIYPKVDYDFSEFNKTHGDGNLFLNCKLEFLNTITQIKTQKTLKPKTLSFDFESISNNNLLLAYTKTNQLYLSMFNLEFNEEILDSIIVNHRLSMLTGDCNSTIVEGVQLDIIYGEKIFVTIGMPHWGSLQLYEYSNQKLKYLNSISNTMTMKFFTIDKKLFSIDKNKLYEFYENTRKEVVFSKNIEILGVYNNSKEIYLAVRPKNSMKKDFFDIVVYKAF